MGGAKNREREVELKWEGDLGGGEDEVKKRGKLGR